MPGPPAVPGVRPQQPDRHGIWGGLTERERRPLQSRLVQDARRDRDRAILAADAAGYTTAAIGRSFGLSQTSVTRIARGGSDARRSVRAQRTAEEDDDRARRLNRRPGLSVKAWLPWQSR